MYKQQFPFPNALNYLQCWNKSNLIKLYIKRESEIRKGDDFQWNDINNEAPAPRNTQIGIY